MIHPKVWDQVPDSEVVEAISAADEGEHTNSDGEAKVGKQDQVLVLLLIQRAAWVEVVDAAVAVLLADTLALWLLLVVVVAGDVPEEIHWPSEQLLSDQVTGSQDWSLLHQLVHFV